MTGYDEWRRRRIDAKYPPMSEEELGRLYEQMEAYDLWEEGAHGIPHGSYDPKLGDGAYKI